ncbi:DUF3927 domain-containing protein [Sutterella faecalis]|uniref:DUF3927 domain-containing protein n=2 Tax=Sutterella TaxID=40544 RepID=A0AAI9SBD0_9BURK|nr:DUF3927 domain-containing protein [Sutterella seckii]QDA55712.1 DUF3927 domain-containing protein [Sutterella faecalis]
MYIKAYIFCCWQCYSYIIRNHASGMQIADYVNFT